MFSSLGYVEFTLVLSVGNGDQLIASFSQINHATRRILDGGAVFFGILSRPLARLRASSPRYAPGPFRTRPREGACEETDAESGTHRLSLLLPTRSRACPTSPLNIPQVV